ncbi:MAG: polysaccharide deacetylase family protein [Ginsengibacter sp.]
MIYLVKTPLVVKKLYPQCVWNLPAGGKTLYLTFDDGPHPEVTRFVLAELKKYNAHATFFCIGNNVQQHFETYKEMISQGHRPGNHTFDHLNGWRVKDGQYLKNIEKAAKIIDSDLFRPPYGRITRFQIKALGGNRFNFRIIMWSVLSGDFDEKLSEEGCYLNVVNNAEPGNVIVFHDSVKAFPRLNYALPRVLQHFSKKGFEFKVIPS